eukprot:5935834-Amphidinium_carterae.5
MSSCARVNSMADETQMLKNRATDNPYASESKRPRSAPAPGVLCLGPPQPENAQQMRDFKLADKWSISVASPNLEVTVGGNLELPESTHVRIRGEFN